MHVPQGGGEEVKMLIEDMNVGNTAAAEDRWPVHLYFSYFCVACFVNDDV